MITILELIIMIMIKMMIMTTMIILIIRWRRRKRHRCKKSLTSALPTTFGSNSSDSPTNANSRLEGVGLHIWHLMVPIFVLAK